MQDQAAGEVEAVRVTSAALDPALLSVTAERIRDGARALVLRDSLTIKEGKDHAAAILGKPWQQVQSTAYLT